MTWTARSLIAFGVGLFGATLAADALFHLIGSPGCESTPSTPVRCSEESGWWALVLGGGLVGALVAARAARQGAVARILLGALLLGGGLAAVWAVVDDRTDAGGWAAGGAISAVLGIALLAGLAAAALRQAREPDLLARPPERLERAEPAAPPAGRRDEVARRPGEPAVRVEGGQDPFGREPGETADPFGGEG